MYFHAWVKLQMQGEEVGLDAEGIMSLQNVSEWISLFRSSSRLSVQFIIDLNFFCFYSYSPIIRNVP